MSIFRICIGGRYVWYNIYSLTKKTYINMCDMTCFSSTECFANAFSKNSSSNRHLHIFFTNIFTNIWSYMIIKFLCFQRKKHHTMCFKAHRATSIAFNSLCTSFIKAGRNTSSTWVFNWNRNRNSLIRSTMNSVEK